MYVEGDVRSGDADSGRPPVKVGGKYTTTLPTLTDGNRGDLNLDSRGNVRVALMSLDQAVGSKFDNTTSDAVPTSYQSLAVLDFNHFFNGASWDRARTPNVIKTVAAVAITAGTGATIWTPTSGKKFRLMGWSLSSSAGAALIFGDNAVGTVILRTELLAAAGISQAAPGFGNGFLSAAANNVLKLDVTANATVSGYVFGTEE